MYNAYSVQEQVQPYIKIYGNESNMLCDKVCRWLAADLWFCISSRNMSVDHDRTKIVLKVAYISKHPFITSSFTLKQ
jgi:hypothetical protein